MKSKFLMCMLVCLILSGCTADEGSSKLFETATTTTTTVVSSETVTTTGVSSVTEAVDTSVAVTTTTAAVTEEPKIEFDISDIDTLIHVDIGYYTAGTPTLDNKQINDKFIQFYYDVICERKYFAETDEAYNSFRETYIVPSAIKTYEAFFADDGDIICTAVVTGMYSDDETELQECHIAYNFTLRKTDNSYKVVSCIERAIVSTSTHYVGRVAENDNEISFLERE